MASRQDNSRVRSFASAVHTRYEAMLRRYLRLRLKNREDVRELAQEVWVRLLRVNDPSRVQNPRAYLYKVAGNVVAEFQHLRRRDPVRFDSETFDASVEHETEGAGDLACALEQESEVYRLMSRLPQIYRRIVLLRICEGASFQEIGEKLGLTTGTAERYCQSALQQIRRSYGPEQ